MTHIGAVQAMLKARADAAFDDVAFTMKTQASKWTTLLLAYQCIGVVFGDLVSSAVGCIATCRCTNLP